MINASPSLYFSKHKLHLTNRTANYPAKHEEGNAARSLLLVLLWGEGRAQAQEYFVTIGQIDTMYRSLEMQTSEVGLMSQCIKTYTAFLDLSLIPSTQCQVTNASNSSSKRIWLPLRSHALVATNTNIHII